MTRALQRSDRKSNREHGGIVSTLIALLFLAVLCGAIYLVRDPILRFAGESWIVNESMDHADAIIVLSDDNFYADRVTRAAGLIREGQAPVVVASGRRLRPYAGIAELMQHDLIERGVAKENIIVFPQDADNTREEAQALLPLVAPVIFFAIFSHRTLIWPLSAPVTGTLIPSNGGKSVSLSKS
jgi:hypothetical protein